MPRKKKDESKATVPSPKKTKEKKPPKTTTRKISRAKDPLKVSKVPKAALAKKSSRSTPGKAATPSKISLLKKIQRHGATQMVAFIRDPRCIFTYWEVSAETVEAVKKQLMDEFPASSMVLRVFRVHPDGRAELLYELEVKPGETNRYLELSDPSGRYFVEVVQKTVSGRIVTYARSNWVSASPDRDSQSPVKNDPQWAPPTGILEYFNEGEDSPEFHVTHQGVSSAESQRGKKSKWDSYTASWTR